MNERVLQQHMGSDSVTRLYWMIVDVDKFGHRLIQQRAISQFMKGKRCVSYPPSASANTGEQVLASRFCRHQRMREPRGIDV